MLKAGLDAEQAFVGNQNGDAKAAHRERREEGRGGLLLSVPEPRPDGADERHGALHGRQVRGVGADAGRRRRRSRRCSPRPACRPTSARSTRSTSAAASAGAARSRTTCTRRCCIAKEMPGTPIKLLWSREEDMVQGRYHPVMHGQAGRRARQGQQPDRPAHAPVGTVDPREPCVRKSWSSRRDATRSRSRACFQTRRALVQLHDPEPADRPRDAQSARPAGLLARREHQPERHLHRMLHGRAGASGGPGRARVPAQAARQASAQPRRAQCGRGEDRLGQAGAGRHPSRPRAHEGVQHLRGGGGGSLRRRRQQAQGPPHRRRRPIRPTPSTRRRSSGRSRARSSTACRRSSIRSAP